MKKTKFSKLAALVLAGAMLLTGCGGAGGSSETETSGDEQLNVAILLNGTLGDKAFYDSAANGGKMIQDELGAKVNVVEMTYDETKWMPTLVDFSEDPETDIIIVGTWQMVEKLQEIAPQYPDKKYIIFDSAVDYSVGGLDNVYSIEYKQNECYSLLEQLQHQLHNQEQSDLLVEWKIL